MKKSIVFLLTMILSFFAVMTVSYAENPTASQIANTLQTLKNTYPDGTHQTAFYNATYTGDGSRCYKNLGGYYSWECVAWASKVYDELWGEEFRKGTHHSNANDIFVGDYVRYYGGVYNNGVHYDHSILVTDIQGDVLYYTDCNGPGSSERIKWDRTMTVSYLQSKLGATLKTGSEKGKMGYISHYPKNNIKSLKYPYVDIGTDFYATINHVKNNYAVSYNSNGYLELAENKTNEKTIWHFMKQDDGSYIIHSGVGSYVMDITNGNAYSGAGIGISNVNYGTAQKWYVYMENDNYVFKSLLGDFVLDVKYPYGSIGDDLQLFQPNQTQAQHFKINRVTPFNDWVYIHNEAETPVLYSDEDVIFNYDAVSANYYDLWLYKDGVRVKQLYAGDSKTYRQKYEAGNYELLFASQNSVGWNYGNLHPFKVVDRVRTVTFDANGGKVTQEYKTLQYNSKYGQLPVATREGYTFTGWYEDIDGTKMITSENLCDSVSNITLYAQWTRNTYKDSIEHWTLGYNNGEGNNMNKNAFNIFSDTFDVKFNEQRIISDAYAKTVRGFSFENAFGNIGIDTVWAKYSMPYTLCQPAKNIRMEFYYYPIQYNINYNLNGGINNPENPSNYNILYGLTFKPPTKEGFEFKGWTDESGQAVTGINDGCTASFINADDFYNKINTRTIGDRTITAQWEYIVPHTETQVLKNGNHYNITVESFNLKTGKLIVGGYKDGILISVRILNTDQVEPLTFVGNFDTFRIMVWDNLQNLNPLCEVEDISQNHFVLNDSV